MTKIRVLVAEDSLTVRKYLVDVLGRDPGLDVIGEAENGKRAVELCRKLRPDVVTMDIVMPEMNGLEATEEIMAFVPTPILIVSSSSNRADAFKAYDALSAGAVDLLEKPRGDEFDSDWEARLTSTVKLVSKIRVITHIRGKLKTSVPRPVLPEGFDPAKASGPRCVAIGASTGGPSAALAILRALPPDFPLPIFLVIHVGEQFGVTLPEWLSANSGAEVYCPKNGDKVPKAAGKKVVMAPPNRHLAVRAGQVWLLDTAERHSCKPSVDVLFESIATEYGRNAMACLLSGMGKDGAAGLLMVRKAGGTTVSQDEATSVIFGMPREAITLGAAQSVLPLGEIAPAIVNFAMGRDRN